MCWSKNSFSDVSSYLHTYLFMTWSGVLLEKLTSFQIVKKFPIFYGAWRFITAFTCAHHLSLSRVPGPRLSVWTFQNKIHLYGELLAPRPAPQAGEPTPVGCPRLLIQYIRSYPPYWRPFLHPQPEDAPCRGDRDPLIMELKDSLSDGFYWLKSDFLVNILPIVSFLFQNKRPEGSDSSYTRNMLENVLPDKWKETSPNCTALFVLRSTKMQKVICTQMTIICLDEWGLAIYILA